jgi:hypothetical protein
MFDCLRLFCYIYFQGMVENAIYIKKVLKEEMILAKAFGKDLVGQFVVWNVGVYPGNCAHSEDSTILFKDFQY